MSPTLTTVLGSLEGLDDIRGWVFYLDLAAGWSGVVHLDGYGGIFIDEGCDAIGPFDDDDVFGIDVFIEAEVFELLGVIEAVGVDVDEV